MTQKYEVCAFDQNVMYKSILEFILVINRLAFLPLVFMAIHEN